MTAKPVSSTHAFRRAFKGAAVAFTLAASSAAAQADGPFHNLNGSWVGPGVITLAEGGKENIRCRGNYTVDSSATNLRLQIRCASEAYKFELTGSVTHVNGSITGIWNETTYSVGGTVSGQGSPGRINVRAEGMMLTALIAMSTRDNKQSVSIRSPGSPLSEVAINMNRATKVADR